MVVSNFMAAAEEIEKLETENADLEADNANLKSDNVDLRAEVVALHHDLACVEPVYAAAVAFVDAYHAETRALLAMGKEQGAAFKGFPDDHPARVEQFHKLDALRAAVEKAKEEV